MATLFLKTAGGNWTDATAWSTVNAGGADNSGPPTAADDCIAEFLSGNVTISAASVGKSFSATAGTGAWTGTMTHNAFTLTISGSITFSAGMTYTPTSTTSSRITMQSSGTLITNGILIQLLRLGGSITLTLGDNLAFISNKICILDGSSPTILNMNGKSISGNSIINRLVIQTTVVGSPMTISSATTAFSNCDFRDITFSSAVNLDLSAITGLSGDCGGNSITGGGTTLTFTPAATQTWSGTTSDNWSTNAWSGRVPLPQDDVIINAAFSASQTVTQDMPRMGKSISWVGSTGSPTWSTNNVPQTFYGSLTLISGMTLSVGSTGTWSVEGRGSFTFNSAGKTFSTTTFRAFGGIITLGSNFAANATVTVSDGTFIDNGFNCTFASTFNSNGTTTRTIIKTGIWTLSSPNGTVWAFNSSGLTFSDSSTIIISDAGASSKTFSGGGLTYKNLQISGGGAGQIIITGANTFKSIQVIGGTKSIQLPGSTTTTLTSESSLGNATNLITFTASAGSATISQTGGIVRWDYVSLTNIPSTGGGAFYAGPLTNSTDGGGNTGWIFTSAPGGAGSGTSADSVSGLTGMGIGIF